MTVPLEVFCCYAREDQEMLEHLKTHLISLQRSGQITIWSDTDLSAGAEWEKELHQHLESADIILLLISPDFMASDYCYSHEMRRAIERHKQDSAQVVPLLLRPVHWEDAPFAQLQIIPTNTEPVTRWSNRDDAFHDTVKHIRQVITDIRIRRALLEASEHTKAIRYQEALACYEHVLRLDQTNGSALFGKARTLFLLRQIDASIEAFTLAEQIAPAKGDNYFSQLFKARALSQRERYAESLMAYNRVVSLDPDNADSYSEQATILIKQQAYELALSALEQARHLKPDNVEYVTQTGDLLFRLRRFEQALTMYRQASQIQPDEASCYEWQGRILLHLERSEDALTAYQHALALSPQRQHYEQIGKLLLRLDRFQEALEIYGQALATIQDDSYLYAGKGQVLIHLERYSEALACFEKAIKLSEPEADPQFYHDLGALHELLARRAYNLEQQRSLMWLPEIEHKIFLPPVFDPAKLTLLHTLSGHLKDVISVAISPNDNILASASRDKTIKLWELPSGRLLRTLTGHTGALHGIAMSLNGRILASAGADHTIRLWELPSGRELHTISKHMHFFSCLAISPDGKILASNGIHYSTGTHIKLWELPSGRELQVFSGHTGYVRCLAFSPDGKLLASGGDKEIKFWELPSGRELQILPGHTGEVHCLAFSPDGKLLATGTAATTKLWKLSSGHELHTLRGGSSLAFSVDGKTLANGGLEYELELWEASSGRKLRTLTGHMDDVECLAFSPSGELLVSGGGKEIKLWGTAS